MDSQVISYNNGLTQDSTHRMDPENPGTYLWMNPGKADGNLITQDKITKDGILAYIEQDAEHYGFYFEDCTTTLSYPEGAYVVALFVDPGDDYHWYRQNSDGTWSHKLGDGLVINTDASGNVIYDPCEADRNHAISNYTDFVGFFYVTPLNTIVPSSLASASYANNLELEYSRISFASDTQIHPTTQQASAISAGMTYSQVTNIVGLPQRQSAYGLLILEYNLSNCSQLVIEYIVAGNDYVVYSCNIIGGDNA